MDWQLVCYYFDKDKNIQTVIYNIQRCSFFYHYDIDIALKYDNLKNIPNLENTFIIISILKSQVKYFICLNTNFQNTLKMYTKRNFPPRRRLWNGGPPNNDNITEFIFTCPNEESLMIFSIFKKDGCLNSLNSNANNGAGIYSFIIEDHENLTLSSLNEIKCLNRLGEQNEKHIFLLESFNNIQINISSENLTHNKETNIAENTYHEQKSTEILPSTNSSIFHISNIQTSSITEIETQTINVINSIEILYFILYK